MASLDHENLDVYQCSIEFLTVALRLVARLPRGEREIRDQLKRASIEAEEGKTLLTRIVAMLTKMCRV